MGKNEHHWKREGDEMLDKYWLSLMERLKKDHEDLTKLFHQNFFERMTDILGDYAEVVTPEGERVKGKDCLKRFFRNEKARGVQTLIFKPVTIFTCQIKEVILNREEPEKSIDFTAHEITHFRLLTEKKNNTGYLSRTLCHPKTCEWHP